MEEPVVLVVGAGLSGLTCASELVRRPGAPRVVVLEASSRVGGRLLTQADKSGNLVDLGGQWIGPKKQQPHIWKVIDRFGLSTHPQRYAGRRVLDLGLPGMKRVYYCSDIPSGLGLVALLVTQIFLWWVDLNAYFRVKWRLFARPASTSTLLQFQQFLRWIPVKESHKEAPLSLACTLVRGVFGVEAEKLSWPHFLRYVLAAGGVDRLATIRNGFQERVLDGGAQQMCVRLLQEIQSCGGNVYTNEHVSHCEFMPEKTCSSAHDVTLHTITSTGKSKKWRAARVVFAIPPTKKAHIQFYGLPNHLRPQAEATLSVQKSRSMGCIIKSVVCYDSAFWHEAGFSGEVVCAPTRNAPVFNVYDHTHSGSPKLVCFINGDAAKFWSGDEKKKHRRQAVLKQLGALFGQSALTPNNYMEKDWVADKYTGGCPVACFSPEISDEDIDMLSTPIGPIYWAGTETADTCQGFMSGAVQSGERAAAQVLQSFAREKHP